MIPELHPGGRLQRQYSFGEFMLDAEHKLLWRGGREVTLRYKSLEVLAYLVEHNGQVVTKDRLIAAIWRDTAVTDNSVSQCMVEIRRALDDNSQQMIRTIARRGYVFAAPVATPAAGLGGAEVAPVEPYPFRVQPAAKTAPRASLNRKVAVGLAVLLAIAVCGLLFFRLIRPKRQELTYTQLTNFTDSAVSPALSPDGRMLAFIRSGNWWLTPGKSTLSCCPVAIRFKSRMITGPNMAWHFHRRVHGSLIP